ncbi:MAG: cytochrome c oxidase subunit II [Synechococcales bacterium]|nr:cytochrome c oxidase subunit II [Synechococcales bacterium]
MEQIPASILTLLAGVVITLISFWVGNSYQVLFPIQASEQAPLVDNLFRVMLTIGTAIFIIVQGTLLYSIIRFRRKPGDDSDGAPLEGNLSLEILWTAVPAVIVIALGLYSVEVYEEMGGLSSGSAGMMTHNHDAHHAVAMANQAVPSDPLVGSAIAAPMVGDVGMVQDADMPAAAPESAPVPETEVTPSQVVRKEIQPYGLSNPQDGLNRPVDLEVNVTGMQFAWIFEYPQQGITSGELHVPVGKAIRLNMKAVDVIHSFWVPQFRIKQDVMPGLPSSMQFVATKVGDYPVFCAELCGSYHGSMRTQTIVQAEEDFANWVTESQAMAKVGGDQTTIAAQPLTEAAYLAPYTAEMGITPEVVSQIHSQIYSPGHSPVDSMSPS